jgi:NAD(P)-dependent dehydrogenase (short-subunit alcohol dehydrogenase family)
MKILITGGLGVVGKATVQWLLERQHTLRILDRPPEPGLEAKLDGVEYHACDITDYAALRPHLEGMDAVIHLAAIPAPMMAPAPELFHINVTGTFNVFQAAAEAGIKRIASASSINALGYNYGRVDFPLRYFPIDEDHPGYSTDAYSFSKQLTEQIGEYFWRRDGISSTHLRLAGVFDASRFPPAEARKFIAEMRTTLQALLDRPPAERQEIIARGMRRFNELRPERSIPRPREEMMKRWRERSQDPDLAAMGSTMMEHSNFWIAVEARDVAQAFEKSLTADLAGSYPLFINDAHNLTGIETEALLQAFFPQVTARTRPITGTESPVSIDRAQALIGYAPQFGAGESLE